ncbi:MAG: cation-efflux pump, partial [Oscillospiraceae bacterium]|nr:cation-efflux pump [Oscillospiraceae bacterium]
APLRVTHDIAHRVHDIIEERFPRVKHCMVHVNPAGESPGTDGP